MDRKGILRIDWIPNKSFRGMGWMVKRNCGDVCVFFRFCGWLMADVYFAIVNIGKQSVFECYSNNVSLVKGNHGVNTNNSLRRSTISRKHIGVYVMKSVRNESRICFSSRRLFGNYLLTYKIKFYIKICQNSCSFLFSNMRNMTN